MRLVTEMQPSLCSPSLQQCMCLTLPLCTVSTLFCFLWACTMPAMPSSGWRLQFPYLLFLNLSHAKLLDGLAGMLPRGRPSTAMSVSIKATAIASMPPTRLH